MDKVWDVWFPYDIMPATKDDPHGRMIYHIFNNEQAARTYAGKRGLVNNRIWGPGYLKGRGVIDHREAK